MHKCLVVVFASDDVACAFEMDVRIAAAVRCDVVDIDVDVKMEDEIYAVVSDEDAAYVDSGDFDGSADSDSDSVNERNVIVVAVAVAVDYDTWV